METLFLWILRASLLTCGFVHSEKAKCKDAKAVTDRFATALAVEATVNPIFKGEDGPKKSAAFILSLAFLEGGNQTKPIGSNDNGTSFCTLQINLPYPNQKTAEGWTGKELVEDPEKCVIVGYRMAKESAMTCRENPLALYARGDCQKPDGIELSKFRVKIAKQLANVE